MNSIGASAVLESVKLAWAVADDKYGIQVPLADLFSWADDPEVKGRVKSAFTVGKETIGGQVCEHIAGEQGLVDWQVWVREGDNALPCKMVITATYDPAQPQYTAVYTWLPDSEIAADSFTFKAPENSHEISIESRGGK